MTLYSEVSAFTRTPGHGNRAGVVLDAAGLSEGEMQRLAAFLDAPETVFVTRMEGGLVRVRYFTPTQEVAFCGHATVALGLLLAQEGHWAGEALALETLMGRVPLRLISEAGVPRQVWMEQPRHETRPVPRELRAELAAALGLDARMVHRGLPPAAASTGLWSVFVPLLDSFLLDALEPDLEAIAQLSRQLWVARGARFNIGRFAAALSPRELIEQLGQAQLAIGGVVGHDSLSLSEDPSASSVRRRRIARR